MAGKLGIAVALKGTFTIRDSRKEVMETDYYATAPASKLLNPNIVPLTLTPEQVRKAASRCPDAEMVLKELFPSVFAPPTPAELQFKPVLCSAVFHQRALGNYENKGYFLPREDQRVWRIVTDNKGCQVLVREFQA